MLFYRYRDNRKIVGGDPLGRLTVCQITSQETNINILSGVITCIIAHAARANPIPVFGG